MKKADLDALEVYLYVIENPPHGLDLVVVPATPTFDHPLLLQGVTLEAGLARQIEPAVQGIADRTCRRVYLLRCRFAELVTVVLPAKGDEYAAPDQRESVARPGPRPGHAH